MKYVIFHDAADSSYTNTVENFMGAYGTAQVVTAYFKSAQSDATVGAAYAITLPTPALAQRGWNAEFIVGTVASNAQTITCPGTDLFHGIGLDGEDGAAQTVTEGTGIDVITIISGATKGDRVGITCDGVSYYFVSFAADKAHITVAAE